jgi:hypothetical protein
MRCSEVPCLLRGVYTPSNTSRGPSTRKRKIKLRLAISEFMNHKGALKTENHWAVLAMLSKIYNFKLPFGNHLSRCMEEYNDSARYGKIWTAQLSAEATPSMQKQVRKIYLIVTRHKKPGSSPHCINSFLSGDPW